MEMASATVRGPNASAMVSATMDDSTVVMMTDEAESQRRSWRVGKEFIMARVGKEYYDSPRFFPLTCHGNVQTTAGAASSI